MYVFIMCVGGNRYVPGSGAPAPAAPTAPSSDPFTGGLSCCLCSDVRVFVIFVGGNRYVPGSGASAPAAPTAPSSDPFTGGGRHIPSYDDKPSPFAASANQATGADPFTGENKRFRGRYIHK